MTTEEKLKIAGSLSDTDLLALMKERERKKAEAPSPFPWTPHMLQLNDASGKQVAHVGQEQYDGPRGVGNIRIMSVGPDGVALAQRILKGVVQMALHEGVMEGSIVWPVSPLEAQHWQADAEALLTKAGVEIE